MDHEFKSKVESIQTKISTLTKELKQLREDCSHPKESEVIRDVNPLGSSEVRKVCGLCGHEVGYPTMPELTKWLE
jgi:hypothetical protein